MHTPSPMLTRARGSTAVPEPAPKRSRIPRRGRIRIALVLLAVACVAFARSAAPRAERGHVSPAENRTVKVSAVAQPNASHRSSLAFQLPHFSLPFFKSPGKRDALLPSWGVRRYTASDVAALLKGHSGRFDNAIDTLMGNGRSMAVHYSLDTTLEKTAETFLKQYHPLHGAVCIMEPATGRVLALVSYTREGVPSLGDNLYARSIFPSASTFKAVTAAGVIESLGYSAQSPVKTLGPNHTLWRQQLVPNSRNTKDISLEEAFAFSINPAFARMGIYLLGADGLDTYASRFGFNQAIPFELAAEPPVFVKPDSLYATAEVASGYNQRTNMSPLFGAMMAATMANGGRMMAPTLVDGITDVATGQSVYSRTQQVLRTPVSSRTAGEIIKMMEKVPEYGTGRKGFRYVKQSSDFAGMSYGGKTGNVDKDGVGRTDWFIGYAHSDADPARDLAIGVVTMHDAYWTVHSSFIAAELMRHHVRNVELARKHADDNDSTLASSARSAQPGTF